MRDTSSTAGLWLGTGSALLAAALIFHGPPDPDMTVQMQHVAENHGRWAMVHWAAAAALFLMSGAGFLTLLARAEGAHVNAPYGAWVFLALGALLTISTAVAEAGVVSVAAASGDQASFDAWWAFSSGMANGFFALAIATGRIAFAEYGADGSRLPSWASMIGTAAGFLSALGWMLGTQLDIWIGGPIWLISTLVMCLWLTWLGLSIWTRAGAPQSVTA